MGFEGKLGLHRACNAGGERRLLVGRGWSRLAAQPTTDVRKHPAIPQAALSQILRVNPARRVGLTVLDEGAAIGRGVSMWKVRQDRRYGCAGSV